MTYARLTGPNPGNGATIIAIYRIGGYAIDYAFHLRAFANALFTTLSRNPDVLAVYHFNDDGTLVAMYPHAPTALPLLVSAEIPSFRSYDGYGRGAATGSRYQRCYGQGCGICNDTGLTK